MGCSAGHDKINKAKDLSLDDLYTVSYTHLDVYKRQILYSANNIENTLPSRPSPSQILRRFSPCINLIVMTVIKFVSTPTRKCFDRFF